MHALDELSCPHCESALAIATWSDMTPPMLARPSRCPSCRRALAVRTDTSALVLEDANQWLAEDARRRPLVADLVPGAWYWITIAGLAMLIAFLSFLDMALLVPTASVLAAFMAGGLLLHLIGERGLAYRERRAFEQRARRDGGVSLKKRYGDYRH
jgi:hypothetical protein